MPTVEQTPIKASLIVSLERLELEDGAIPGIETTLTDCKEKDGTNWFTRSPATPGS